VARDWVEDGKRVYVLYRPIEPFWRLSSPEPRYERLHGANIYLHHVAVAEALTEKMRRISGVEAILGLGSLSRGFADEWSDVDLAVLGRGRGLRGLWHGERWLAGLSIDLFVVDLDRAPPAKWDNSRRQAFEESVVLFSRDTSVVRALRRAGRLGKKERIEKIRETLLKLGWLGFEPRTWYGQCKYGYVWSLPHDLWFRRGSVASAHMTVDQAVDYALQLLFLTNGRRVPDPKWRRYLAPGLPWLPADFNSLLERVEKDRRDDHGFRSRAESVLWIIEQTVQYLEETGAIGDDLYQTYLRVSPEYNPWM
jgi:predicted nucleotidyltransferase